MQFTPCDKCDKGFLYYREQGGFRSVQQCNCKKEYNEKVLLTSAIKKAGLPISTIDYSVGSYLGQDSKGNLNKIGKYVSDFNTRYSKTNLFFSGVHGTQKSTLGRYIGRELIKQSLSVNYFLTDKLIKLLIKADRDPELERYVNEILDCDFLILDEMSTDKVVLYESGWQIKFLLPFLKDRIEMKEKAVLFISNSSINNLGEAFSGAIQDLIYRSVIDKTMVFEDVHEHLKDEFDPTSLWD